MWAITERKVRSASESMKMILATPGTPLFLRSVSCRVASEVARAPTIQEMLVEKLICHYSACKAELLRFADVTERIHAPRRYTQPECSVIFESYVSGSTRICTCTTCVHTRVHTRERTSPLGRLPRHTRAKQFAYEARDKSMPLRLDAGTE